MPGQEKPLETARHEVPLKEIVVDFAHITCDCAQLPARGVPIGERSANIFRVGEGHGISEKGHYCAHDQTCAPITNIPNFGTCYSPQYFSALEALMSQCTDSSSMTAYEAAHKIAGEWSAGAPIQGPCLLKLLDRWFNADEHSAVTDYFDLTGNITSELQTMFRSMKYYLNAFIIFDMKQKYVREPYEAPKKPTPPSAKPSQPPQPSMPSWPPKRGSNPDAVLLSMVPRDMLTTPSQGSDSQLERMMYDEAVRFQEKAHNMKQDRLAAESAVNARINDISSLKDKISPLERDIKLLAKSVVLADSDFSNVKRILNEICTKLETIDQELTALIEESPVRYKSAEATAFKNSFGAFKAKVGELKAKFDSIKPKSYYLIKMDSFLVCKLGGIIEFQTSGQERLESFLSLYQTLLTTLGAMKNFISTAPAAPDQTEIDLIWTQYSYDPKEAIRRIESKTAEKNNTYGNALGELNKFIAYAAGTKPVNEAKTAYFEIRFVSHKVYEEMGKIIAISAILSAIPGASGFLGVAQTTLSWGLVTYDAVSYITNKWSWEAVGDATTVGAIFESKKMLPTTTSITNVNLILALTINLPKYFYTSLDDWIEFMEIKMQIGESLFIARQTLDKSGKAVGSPDFSAPTGNERHRLWIYDASTGGAELRTQKSMFKKEELRKYEDKESIKEIVVPNSDPCPNSCQH